MFRVPGLNLFRCQGRHAMGFTLAVAILAGLGLASLARGTRRSQSLRLAALTAALAGILGGAWVWLRRLGMTDEPPRPGPYGR